jgi:hypothetical protein
MPLLRVGKVRPENGPPSNTAINSGIEPPRLTHAMWEVKMKFIKATIRLLVIHEAKQEDVFAVEWWVLMPQNTVTVNMSGSKRKYGENGQHKTPTTTQLSTPSVKTPTQNSTMITPTSNMIPSLDKRHTLSQEFLVLSSFNPGLLQCGSRVVNEVDLDCQLFNGMIDESVRLCAKLKEPLQFQYQNGKHGIRLIKLPMSKSNSSTVTPNIKKCIDEMLSVFGDTNIDGVHNVVIDTLLDYLVKSNRTKLMEKLRERKMIPKVMDKFDCAALLDESGIKIWQWKKIQQCLKLFMDIPQVGVAEKHLRALGIDHSKIKHGTYYYSDPTNPTKVKEEVRYWTKDPVYKFVQMLQGTINGYDLDPLDIDFIHIIYGGDHGKNKFCFATKLILSMKNGKLYSQIFGLADVACRKDHVIILTNTCMPFLMKGINTIEESDVIFSYASDADEGELNIDLAPSKRYASGMQERSRDHTHEYLHAISHEGNQHY